MSRLESLVTPSPQFAYLIDTACEMCLGDFTTNNPQLALLQWRKKAFPQEIPILNELQRKCTDCYASGKDELMSLTATHSCIYRGGL